MRDITWNDFVRVVDENDGEVLPTIGGRKTFRLQRTDHGVSFTPRSSGFPRKLNSWDIERYLEVFNETRSFNTSLYTENFRNQSYVLAIIKLIVGQSANAKLIDDGISDTGEIDPEFSAPEGKAKVISHRRRERSRALIEMAKAKFKSEHGRLFCEVCRFDFGKTYDEPDFIEAHHMIPLKDLKEGSRTKLSDLAMVCPNCHRMLHRGSPWPSLDELRHRLKL